MLADRVPGKPEISRVFFLERKREKECDYREGENDRRSLQGDSLGCLTAVYKARAPFESRLSTIKMASDKLAPVQVTSRKPFLIGVAGGSASGKVRFKLYF